MSASAKRAARAMAALARTEVEATADRADGAASIFSAQLIAAPRGAGLRPDGDAAAATTEEPAMVTVLDLCAKTAAAPAGGSA